MPFVDAFLNKITMYRLVFWGLSFVAVLSIVLGFTHLISYGGDSLIALLALLVGSCWGADIIFSRIVRSDRNYESSWITALILFFILAPIVSVNDVWITIVAGIIAASSKYLFAIHKRHVFNPAAFAALAVGLAGTGSVIWWVATPILLPVVAVLGLLIVRKIRHFDLFWSFIVTQTIVLLAYNSAVFHMPVLDILQQNIVSWPVMFFATVMLTEPFTTPPTRKLRIFYGVITGLLFAIPFHVGSIYSTPQLALIIGNVFAYLVSSKQRLVLTLKSKSKLSAAVYEFIFTPDRRARFSPGQYMEWTLSHAKTDVRGNRRYFTIASAPSDADVRLGVRISEGASSFKKALLALPLGGRMSAASIAGGFTLPTEKTKRVLCIAGGIGVTPFVSMMRHMIDMAERRDMVVMYVCNKAEDFAYQDIFEEARQFGVQPILIEGKPITKELIENEVRDYAGRTWYLSGPQGMVQVYKNLARQMGVPYTRIKTDYFPGL